MTPSIINPYIRVAMHSVIPSGHNITRRVIYDYELIYLERGNFTIIYDGVSYHCSEGDIIFIRPNISHSFRIDNGEISQPHIHFDLTHRIESNKIPVSFKDIDNMTEEEKNWIHKDYFVSYPATPFVKVQNKSIFLDIFYRLISEKKLLLKKALMIQLLSMLIDDNFPDLMKEKESLSVAYQIKDYIDAGNGLRMNLDDFSKSFYHSKFYLEKKFKETFGFSLIEYRNNKRMEFANHLLEKHSVSKVADELGYQSIYAFSRAYKQRYGISPSKRKGEYRLPKASRTDLVKSEECPSQRKGLTNR